MIVGHLPATVHTLCLKTVKGGKQDAGNVLRESDIPGFLTEARNCSSERAMRFRDWI